MKRSLFPVLVVILAFLVLCIPSAGAGQTVIINEDVNGNVFGNGTPSHTDQPNVQEADGNTVIVNNTVTGDVIGGLALSSSDSATATGDSVTINGGGEVTNRVYGGYARSTSDSATATGNSVTITGGTVNVDVFGGYAYSVSGSATVTGNSVTINGGTVGGDVAGGYAYPVSGSATVTGNSVTINDGTVVRSSYGGSVYGGYAYSESGSATTTGNSVTINDGEVSYVFGGFARTKIGSSTSTGNSVTINGGEVGNVLGGYASSESGSATTTGNSVTINGGEVTDSNVYGGFATSISGSFTATHNTVTISGSPVFGASVGLFGGAATGNGAKDAFTGNTLNVWNYTGTEVASVQNFQYYNFILPSSLQGLKVTGSADLNGSTATGVSVIGGAAPAQPGTSMTLIDGAVTGNLASTQAQGRHGATLLYDWILDATSGLSATLNSVQANPQTKSLSEGFLAGTMLTNRAADLLAEQGIANALRASRTGFGIFGALSGGRSHYTTGSHVDMSGVSLTAGLARGMDSAPGRLTLGAFFEFGTGSYDTHNSFANAASVNGDGDAHYLGGGVLGRMDFHDAGPGRFYAEASARIGHMRNDYNSSDLRDALGRNAAYDSSTAYYGLHFGTGYLWNITARTSLDLSGKYFWTRQTGDSVTLSTNDPVKFRNADSRRLRLSGRFSFAVNDRISPYAGAAYEYEFDGKARASTYGHAIAAPSLRGGTGIGEIGVRLNPSPSAPLSLDLGVRGYVGKREGVTGTLRVGFEF